LFSNEAVASYINDHFEPAWQSVRPVPRVTIDFGNGTVVRRTLHGNVATYVCDASGKTLDVLPGIYEPRTYVDRLGELAQLHRYVRQDRLGRMGEVNDLFAKVYHRRQSDALKDGLPREVFAEEEVRRASILAVESGVKIVLQPAQRIAARGAVASGTFVADGDLPKPGALDELLGWKALAEDTALNETVRRRQIHDYLGEAGPLPPEKLTKWLYREVLRADLDDPYLGLGKILFESYPFADEDK
jgi:hypothetical protein